MLMLFLGGAIWAGTHLMVSVAPELRGALVARLGELPYKGLFSLALVIALVLMVMGWKTAPATAVWLPPAPMRHITMLLVPIAVVLFLAARLPTDIKQLIRHPQLTGVKLWAVAHLLSNGEARSLVLFGGMLLWAVLEVIFINRRDGKRARPPKVGALKTTISTLVALLVAGVLVFAHPWLSGMPLMAR